MRSVADHLKEFHNRMLRDSELAKEEHAGIAARHKRIAELHRELHKSTGASDSPHARLAIEHDGLAQRHETLAKRIGEHGQFHQSMSAEAAKAASAVDLTKNASRRSDDEIVPTRVSAIGSREGLRLIPRTGQREATNDDAVAPQLAKMTTLDD